MHFKMVVSILRTDLTDRVVKAAKQCGATGATIIQARGTGLHEAKSFFGLSLEPPRDVVLLLLLEHMVQPVMAAIATAGEFSQPGTGVALVLETSHVIGMESQIAALQEESR